MKNHKPVTEKFKKKNNICNICQKHAKLSEDHVPPKVCPSAKNQLISKFLYQMTNDRSFRPRISQSGVSYTTICSDCNNDLGSKYDLELGSFSKKVESFVESNITLPSTFSIECSPNAIMRSILGHLLAAKTEDDEVVIDKLIRPCILDPSKPIHDDIHIFYWVYPYEKTIILRDFGMPAIRGRMDTAGFFNMIKFYPIAFLITHGLASYENLRSLHQFNGLSPNEKAYIQIDLQPVQNDTWPETLDLENFLMLGRSAHDSVYATPRIRTIKT